MAVATRQGATFAVSPSDLVTAAKEAAISALRSPGIMSNLASRRADLKLRNLVLSQIPDRQSISQVPDHNLEISIRSPFPAELSRRESLIDAGKVDEVIANYPVRYSGALDALARAMHLRNREDYERVLLTQVGLSTQLCAHLRGLLSPLNAELE